MRHQKGMMTQSQQTVVEHWIIVGHRILTPQQMRELRDVIAAAQSVPSAKVWDLVGLLLQYERMLQRYHLTLAVGERITVDQAQRLLIETARIKFNW